MFAIFYFTLTEYFAFALLFCLYMLVLVRFQKPFGLEVEPS